MLAFVRFSSPSKVAVTSYAPGENGTLRYALPNSFVKTE